MTERRTRDRSSSKKNRSKVARLTIDRSSAERLFSALSECLDQEQVACALFETEPERWTIAIHYLDAAHEPALRRMVAAAAGRTTASKLTFESILADDWTKASLAGLTPVAAGRFFVHGSHHRDRKPPNRVCIEIEAALAFGTGHHGTTRGCLLVLDALLKRRRPRRVIDIGTGTGVLAIAAARALRRRVLASEIDPQAVTTARANAGGNAVGAYVRVVRANGLRRRCFRARPCDLVFANILLGPLQRLACPIAKQLSPHGRVILSGLLPADANAACAAYRVQGLALEQRVTLEGWVTLLLRRGGDAPST